MTETNLSRSTDSQIDFAPPPQFEDGARTHDAPISREDARQAANNMATPVGQNGAMNDLPDEKRIRLLLLGDHGLFRASLARLLALESGFEVVGECDTSAEALKILNGSSVAVILLDFNVAAEHATDFISAAQAAGYKGQFLIIAGKANAEGSAVALKLGVAGIFLKSEAPERLIQAIRLVTTGAVWVDPRIIQLLVDQCVNHPPGHGAQKSKNLLEDREQKALSGILGGLTNKKIAAGMGLSEGGVKNILQCLFAKAGVRTRSQLVRMALEGSLGNVRE